MTEAGHPDALQSDDKWREERERMAQVGSQAKEAITNMSAATLDGVVFAAENLKAKLAEYRQQSALNVQERDRLAQLERWAASTKLQAETKEADRPY